MPFFSIITPVYNRESEIGRALDSCLLQTDADFEIVVADDASTDRSLSVIASYEDRRIKTTKHQVNRGTCAARNTAIRAASGEWLVFLDSDDELTIDALEIIRRRIGEVTGVDKLLLGCQYPDGTMSPDPPLPAEIWEYEDYLAWHGRMVGRRSEAMPVVRRAAYLEFPYEDGHAPEGLHDLDLLTRYRMYACPDIVRLYHQDAATRAIRPSASWLRKNGAEYARAFDQILDKHGEALSRHAVPFFNDTLRSAAYYHFFAGNRRDGLRRAVQAIRRTPSMPSNWALMIIGAMGPSAMALAKRLRG